MTTNLVGGCINECFKDQQSSLSFLLFLSPVRDLWNQGNMPMDYNWFLFVSYQVSHLSFYDVLLDFVLLDAFDDLETPPYTVATAVQNRWLSARIKETVSTLGPVPWKSTNFSRLKPNLKIKIIKIKNVGPRYQTSSFLMLTDTFVILSAKLLKFWSPFRYYTVTFCVG